MNRIEKYIYVHKSNIKLLYFGFIKTPYPFGVKWETEREKDVKQAQRFVYNANQNSISMNASAVGSTSYIVGAI